MARRHRGGTSPPPPPCTLGVGRTKELPSQLWHSEKVEPLGYLLISSLAFCSLDFFVEVCATAVLRWCVRFGSRSATEARCCSPTAAARRWKDVPEERMWQQEVLILTAPAQPGHSLQEIWQEIHSGRRGNPQKVSRGNLVCVHRKSIQSQFSKSAGNLATSSCPADYPGQSISGVNVRADSSNYQKLQSFSFSSSSNAIELKS